MKPEDILKSLGGAVDAGVYRATAVEVTHEDYTSAVEVNTRILRDWAGAEGWIARQSKVFILPREADGPTEGAVLEAELTLGTKTMQLRRLTGKWRATLITEGVGEPCLADDLRVVTVGQGVAIYRRFWVLPDDGAAEVTACRFVKFDEVTP